MREKSILMKYFYWTTLFCLWMNAASFVEAQSAAPTALKGAVYTLDKSHSLMDFTARHKGFGRVRGTFNNYRASMYFVPGDLEASSVSAVIDVLSLDTQDPGRDEHIREVFFEASKYPRIRFQSLRIEKAGDEYMMYGELSVKDVAREVKLPLSVLTLNGMDQWENKRIVLETSLTINRRDYNVVYANKFWDAVVSDEIKIDISFGAQLYNARNNIFPWRKNSIATFIKNGVAEEGLETTLNKVRSLWETSSGEYNFGIDHFYRAGLALAQGEQEEEGLAVLQLAVELHKVSAEAEDLGDLYAGMAEIYGHNRQLTKAKEATTAALEVDPYNPSALELHRRLNGTYTAKE